MQQRRYAINTGDSLNAGVLKPYLLGCGYRSSLLRANFRFGDNQQVAFVGFAHPPPDARSACIVVLDVTSNAAAAVASCRPLAAPVVLTCHAGQLQWWKQGTIEPQRIGRPRILSEVPAFFEENGQDFAPDRVYRAKTWGRFDQQYQLSFVDLGLMPLVEAQIGSELNNLIERNVSALKTQLGWQQIDKKRGHWVLQTIFWLVSAKILRDKQVPNFADLDITEVDEIFQRVAAHYGTANLGIDNRRQQAALQERAADIARFSNLALATTEALAFVYENALVSEETRSELGTHSTRSSPFPTWNQQ